MDSKIDIDSIIGIYEGPIHLDGLSDFDIDMPSRYCGLNYDKFELGDLGTRHGTYLTFVESRSTDTSHIVHVYDAPPLPNGLTIRNYVESINIGLKYIRSLYSTDIKLTEAFPNMLGGRPQYITPQYPPNTTKHTILGDCPIGRFIRDKQFDPVLWNVIGRAPEEVRGILTENMFAYIKFGVIDPGVIDEVYAKFESGVTRFHTAFAPNITIYRGFVSLFRYDLRMTERLTRRIFETFFLGSKRARRKLHSLPYCFVNISVGSDSEWARSHNTQNYLYGKLKKLGCDVDFKRAARQFRSIHRVTGHVASGQFVQLHGTHVSSYVTSLQSVPLCGTYAPGKYMIYLPSTPYKSVRHIPKHIDAIDGVLVFIDLVELNNSPTCRVVEVFIPKHQPEGLSVLCHRLVIAEHVEYFIHVEDQILKYMSFEGNHFVGQHNNIVVGAQVNEVIGQKNRYAGAYMHRFTLDYESDQTLAERYLRKAYAAQANQPGMQYSYDLIIRAEYSMLIYTYDGDPFGDINDIRRQQHREETLGLLVPKKDPVDQSESDIHNDANSKTYIASGLDMFHSYNYPYVPY